MLEQSSEQISFNGLTIGASISNFGTQEKLGGSDIRTFAKSQSLLSRFKQPGSLCR